MITITNAQPLHPAFQLPKPLTLHIEKGMKVALVGANGSGKTSIARILSGSLPLRSGSIGYGCSRGDVRYIAFRDAWGDVLPAAHQLRWHHGEHVSTPTVKEYIHSILYNKEDLMAFPEVKNLLEKPLHWLSSGELRKLHLVKALAGGSRVAIIDEPFIGLDAEGRKELTAFLAQYAEDNTLMMLLADERDIPPFVTHVAHVDNMQITDFGAYIPTLKAVSSPSVPAFAQPESGHDEVVRLNNISVTYFGKPIVKNLDWTIKAGERWALTGPNGAGKSTLLSIIYADNPMAYACDVSVFGIRRGLGNNIWDVKRRIGYVSPEQLRSVVESRLACDIVAAGMSDTGRLHRAATMEERKKAIGWLERIDASHLADRDFLTLSDGERRQVLLARAFVKHPDLLILDEPFHGLDPMAKMKARRLIVEYLAEGHTLIMVSHYPDEYEGITNLEMRLEKQQSA